MSSSEVHSRRWRHAFLGLAQRDHCEAFGVRSPGLRRRGQLRESSLQCLGAPLYRDEARFAFSQADFELWQQKMLSDTLMVVCAADGKVVPPHGRNRIAGRGLLCWRSSGGGATRAIGLILVARHVFAAMFIPTPLVQ